jgi:hypothetical protein
MSHEMLKSVPPQFQAEAQRHAGALSAALATAPPHVQTLATQQVGSFLQSAAAAGIDWAQIISLLPSVIALVQNLIAALKKPTPAPAPPVT